MMGRHVVLHKIQDHSQMPINDNNLVKTVAKILYILAQIHSAKEYILIYSNHIFHCIEISSVTVLCVAQDFSGLIMILG